MLPTLRKSEIPFTTSTQRFLKQESNLDPPNLQENLENMEEQLILPTEEVIIKDEPFSFDDEADPPLLEPRQTEQNPTFFERENANNPMVWLPLYKPVEPPPEERCSFCLKILLDDQRVRFENDRKKVLRKKVEFVLSIMVGSSNIFCCRSCWRMFELFYGFKKSCLMALSQPEELLASVSSPKQTVKSVKTVTKTTTARAYKKRLPNQHVRTPWRKDAPPEPSPSNPVERSHECYVCNKKFTRKCSLDMHLASHFNPRSENSDSESNESTRKATVPEKAGVKEELRDLLDDQPFVFERMQDFTDSSSSGRSEDAAKRCMTAARTSLKYVCKFCKQKFPHEGILKRHYESCSSKLAKMSEYSRKCPLCARVFQNQNQLVIHLRDHNECEEDQPVALSSASVKGQYSDYLLPHAATATSNEEFPSHSTCDEGFLRDEALGFDIRDQIENPMGHLASTATMTGLLTEPSWSSLAEPPTICNQFIDYSRNNYPSTAPVKKETESSMLVFAGPSLNRDQVEDPLRVMTSTATLDRLRTESSSFALSGTAAIRDHEDLSRDVVSTAASLATQAAPAILTSECERKDSAKNQRKMSTYSNSNLLKAIDSVKRGLLSAKRASKDFCVPRSTIQYRMSSNNKNKGKRGRGTVLTPDEEISIVNKLKEMQERGFPVTTISLQFTVAKFLTISPRPNPFRENIPGRQWLKHFLQRHKDLASEITQAVSKASSCLSEPAIRSWFSRIKDHLVKNGLEEVLNDPARQVNAAETGFELNQSSLKNVPINDYNNAKHKITVLYCFSADGHAFPPQVILPYKRVRREVVQSFPQEWGLSLCPKGWIDSDNFMLYIQRILHPSLVKKGVKLPVLCYVDGRTSHTALEAARACEVLGIVLIALYPNSKRILQPADAGIFEPLKQNWATSFENYKTSTGHDCITIRSFATVLEPAMAAAFNEETIMQSFRACGLFPFNPDVIDYSKCLDQVATEREAMFTGKRSRTVCYLEDDVVHDAEKTSFNDNYADAAFNATAFSDGTLKPQEQEHSDSGIEPQTGQNEFGGF